MKKLCYGVGVLLALCLCSPAAQAQTDTDKDKQTAAKTTAKSETKTHGVTMTGCLAKGDSADEYKITADNGKTYEVRSGLVQLDPHVGHTVTLTGAWVHESAKEETKEGKNKEEHQSKERYLRARDLKMVSDTCAK